MALTGRIRYGVAGDIRPRTPNGSFLLIGEDGDHYLVLGGDSYYARVGHIESNTLIHSINQAQWQSDLASVGLAGLTGTYRANHFIPLPGTSKFYIFGGGYIGQANRLHVVGVLYSIVDSSTVSVVGGFIYSGSTPNTDTFEQGGVIGFVHCAEVIGSDLWFIVTCGFIKTVLAKVPISGTNSDATPGSWTSRVFSLPWNYLFWHESVPRRYYNQGSIRDAGGGTVGVMVYLGQPEIDGGRGAYSGLSPDPTGPVVVYTEVTPGVGHSGVEDLSSLFGVPFPDSERLFDGSVSSNSRDDYTSPSVISGTTEIIFSRTFSDQKDTGRFRSFTMTSSASIIAGDVTEAAFSIGSGWTLGTNERAMAYREGSEYHFTIMDWDFAYFGLLQQESGEVVTPVECAEDEEDQIDLCTVTWPECSLIPRRINVDVVSPTVSAGRAFSGFEQVLKPDAGFWRITYYDIAVRSRAEALLWRQIETDLNGRVGTICVPVYEGKLSAVDILAVAVTQYPIGAASVGIVQTAGADIRAGMHFSVGEWLYRIKSVTDPGQGYTLAKIWPPLRAIIQAAEPLEFNLPRCRCRLERDDSMDINLELLRFGNPSVTFVEDV